MAAIKSQLRLSLVALSVLVLTVVSAQAVEDTYWASLGPQGVLLEGGGSGYNNGTWYYYPNTNWWNQWFYNAPYDPERKKVIEIQMTVEPLQPGMASTIEVALNWSTGAWSQLGNERPPLPRDVSDLQTEQKYIAREVLGQVSGYGVISVQYEISDYNPEWVSIDIRGQNVRIIREGWIKHECVPKVTPTEACCLPDGSCVDVSASTCRQMGGTPQGPGTNCSTTICPQPPQACCLPDGSCVDTDPATCQQMGGTPQGVGTNCNTVVCPQPPQACCLPDGTCVDVDASTCRLMGGAPQGAGTTCSTVNCPSPCDWQVGDPHKMHFPQLPDPNGWDVDVTWANILADDWKCSQTGPVQDIHFWHSWWHDNVGIIDSIRVSIYSNIPAGGEAGSYSKPGQILWQRDFGPGGFSLCYWGSGNQGFMIGNEGIANDHKQIYQCDIVDIPDPFIQQQGTIYWLAISVVIRDPVGTHIGWKTSQNHFEDDAVHGSPAAGWIELRDPRTQESLDLAFVITGEGQPEPESELGDAPDSSNTIGAQMTAYPKGGPAGVPAMYPTVYQVGSPPHGPIHWHPSAVAYLGPAVSLENEADVGPDEDGVNNIVPANDAPDLDNFDDGVQVPLVLPHCEFTTFDYTVTVVPLLIEPPPLYVNVWFDWSRDGDWDDNMECQDVSGAVTPVPEWAVQNQELNFVTHGQYTVTTPAFMCWHPAGGEQNPIWMRITLSEQKWQPPVSASIPGFGGSGPATGYKLGETEDYYFAPEAPPPEPKPLVEHLKWSQPPIEWTPMSRTPLYCGWDERSIVTPFQWKVVADDFRCIGNIPITSVHWWGSYIGWAYSNPPALSEDGFYIGFWTNVAAGKDPDIPFSYPGKLIWQTYRNEYDKDFVGYDEFPRNKIADNPTVTVTGGGDFNWAAWGGWWVRGNSTAMDFKFTGIPAVSGPNILVKLNLGVTNHLNGEKGLDGLVDVTINPAGPSPYIVTNVLLDNVDRTNHIYAMQGAGSYETTACIKIPATFILPGGILTVRVQRHVDVLDGLPAAPVCTNQPIDMSTIPPTVPSGCYDSDDAHTVHIHVATDSTGQVAANGEVTIWDMQRDACFQYSAQFGPKDYFWQDRFTADTDDNIFWISIVSAYSDSAPNLVWGWKTRPSPWMDDAVKFTVTGDIKTGYVVSPRIITPIENELGCGGLQSYDMAFELDTDPNYIKWEQAYTGIRDWPHYEDEKSTAVEWTETGVKWLQPPDLTTTGVDVDATAYIIPPVAEPQVLADDYLCTTTGPITEIDIWGSWFNDVWSETNPAVTTFVLTIRADIPASDSQTGYSMPGQILWQKAFGAGKFTVTRQEAATEGYYNPCYEKYDAQNHKMVYKYSFSINPNEAFVQKGTTAKPVVYWLCVQAQLMFMAGAEDTSFGWKTSSSHWNDDAVWASGEEPYSGTWHELRYPSPHPYHGRSIDLAFTISTVDAQPGGTEYQRIVADDWRCERRTPISSIVWWGSYIGYKYRACLADVDQADVTLPTKPDYFLLSMWSDVPDPNIDDATDYSHPGQKIWEYKATEYDEVLVGYDKHPEYGTAAPPVGREPVFRYSVRLPKENWFCQKNINGIYWLSVVAVYKDRQTIKYPWGWTNHKCTTWEPAGMTEVLYWKLDETTGTVANDSSGNDNDGSLFGDATWAQCCGRLCGALDLDGNGDYAKVDAPVGLNFAPGSFSTSAWIRARQVTGSWRTILEYDRNGWNHNWFGMWLNQNAKFHFRVGLITCDSIQTLSADRWYLLTGVYDSTAKKMSLYVNGQFDTSAGVTQGFTTANVANLTVGVRGSQDGEYFNGLIDDVRICAYALSAGEVEALYTAGRNDDAVAGKLVSDPTGADPIWVWEPLHDQTGMSEDMSFILFTEPGCFPCDYTTYWDWLTLGKPNCWCGIYGNPTWPYQCDGDADNLTEGPTKYRVYAKDLDALAKNWKKKLADPTLNPCADFDHKSQGPTKYRVYSNDLNILIANWKKKDAQLPGNCPRPE